MATLQNLYNNIKTFVHQKFEYKTEEDINLPAYVENLFGLENGRLTIYPIVADFTKWSGTQPIYSDFILPDNHEITITFKSTPDVQIACSDTSDNWIYAQNIGYDNSNNLSYRDSNGNVMSKLCVLNHTIIKYQIICKNNIVSYYVYYRDVVGTQISTDPNTGELIITDDIRTGKQLVHSTQTYDINDIKRRIRIYNNANSIDTLTVRQVQ